jgi:hypothetical protein
MDILEADPRFSSSTYSLRTDCWMDGWMEIIRFFDPQLDKRFPKYLMAKNYSSLAYIYKTHTQKEK